MRKKGVYIMLSLWSLFFYGGCIDPYEPPVIGKDHRFLVVEGFVAGDDGSSHIRLSRTAMLADTAMVMPELNARLQLEGEDQSLQQLHDEGRGLYGIDGLNLQEGLNYQLRILTADGSEYLSDLIQAKKTPPIDSLSWSRNEEGVHVYVNTHDPENATTYYRWDYEETWEFDADYFSMLEYVDGGIVLRDPDDAIFTCWQSNQSKNILLGSSARLSEDIIHMQPLAFIPDASWKLSKKYSILVRQYAISKEAFDYFQQMKRNTELGGSIFAPLPTELSGNIHCLSRPDEPVIGYVGAYKMKEERIYINNRQLPGWNYPSQCYLTPVAADSIDLFFGDMNYVPVYHDYMANIYYGSQKICVDCRQRGKTDKPDFWE